MYDSVRGDGRRIDVLVANVGPAEPARLEDEIERSFWKLSYVEPQESYR